MRSPEFKAWPVWKFSWPNPHHVALIGPMIRREVAGRYRGSVLGIIWSLLTPLFMLAVYTFVFGAVFKTRWAGAGTYSSLIRSRLRCAATCRRAAAPPT